MTSFYKITFCIIIFIFFFCETIDDKELQNKKHIHAQEKRISEIEFLVECYGCNPTFEDLLLYQQIKKQMKFKNELNPFLSSEIDIDRIRQGMTNKNPNI